jgi:hypothetical protein
MNSKPERKKTINFNTGRKYTAEGQVIFATLHHDGMVTFMDHSRHICGEFKIGSENFDQETVMWHYDNGKYHMSARANQDGMYKGGCNTRP